MAFVETLKSDFMKNTLAKAQPIVDEDRQRYKIIWEVLLQYCKEKELIISDKLAFFKSKKIRDSYSVYAINPFRHALEITNRLYKKLPEKLIRLNTVKIYEEFTIEIDTRVLITIFTIQKYKEYNNKQLTNAFLINEVYYMPPEIEIIEVYNDLYNPAKFAEWKDLTEIEGKLYELVIERNDAGILGSGISCKKIRKEFTENFKIELIKKWCVENTHIVVIGNWALEILNKTLKDLCGTGEKLQIISDIEPVTLLNELNDFLNENNDDEENPSPSIKYREQDLHIPKDFRTRRYTYYVVLNTTKGVIEKPILDLFNSAEFELIPYQKISGINLGSKYVILRFLFIDLWIIRLIEIFGVISKDILKEKIKKIMKIIFAIHQMKDSLINFLGCYRDYMIDKKLSNLNSSNKGSKYVPEKFMRDNGKLWEIGGQ